MAGDMTIQRRRLDRATRTRVAREAAAFADGLAGPAEGQRRTLVKALMGGARRVALGGYCPEELVLWAKSRRVEGRLLCLEDPLFEWFIAADFGSDAEMYVATTVRCGLYLTA